MEHRVKNNPDHGDTERQIRRVLVSQSRVEHEATEHSRPEPKDHHASTVAVAHLHQTVVQMALVRRGQALAACRTPDDSEQRVEDRYAQDEERDNQRSEEKIGRSNRLLFDRVDTATNHARRHCEQQAEQQRSPVTHEDACGVEVVRQKADTEPCGDHGEERPDVGAVEQIEVGQPLAVQKERDSSDADDAGRETIEAIDQIDNRAHTEQPQNCDQRAKALVKKNRTVIERKPEGKHDHAELHERNAGEHDSEDLRRRRNLPNVVDQANCVDDSDRHKDASRLRIAAEHDVERPSQRCSDIGGNEADVHRQPPDVREWRFVHRAIVGEVHPTHPTGKHPDERRHSEGHSCRHQPDHHV